MKVSISNSIAKYIKYSKYSKIIKSIKQMTYVSESDDEILTNWWKHVHVSLIKNKRIIKWMVYP